MSKRLNVALIGNPKTGKSSVFNDLTGLNQKVGNYPGITVEKKECLCKLERLTLSSSTNPINPTPALERNSAAGDPRPPAPTIRTLEDRIFF